MSLPLKNKIAGVVVLYNPDSKVWENIESYLYEVGQLYIIDNSDSKSQTPPSRISTRENVIYINNRANLGIAHALNQGARLAIQASFEWLLTMDQDSRASDNMVGQLLSACQNIKKEEIGIIAPRYVLGFEKESPKTGIEDVLTTITSGNLLNLEAYSKAGPFREDFFIDYVDHEFCLRLKLYKYKVLINNDVLLYHALGESQHYSFFGQTLSSSNHSFIRRYYITRNRLAVLDKYRKHFPDYFNAHNNKNFKELVKLILFEKDKLRKFKSVVRGFIDFKRNRFGKYTHK